MHRFLYKVSRKTGKAATKINDIKTLMTGNPKKIAKRYARKQSYKQSHKGANNIASKIVRLLKLK